ncbi:serine-rich adhesin for platelets-like [Macrobrachium rosenbergii]|uniref:serine-rich adhesin for platelets-like n=1 Tax=Macrobrachium rosenbergii TaxID=79674 RepID=UPI0034D7956C
MLEGDTPFQAMGRSMLRRLKETPGRFDFVRQNINGQKSFRELFTFIYDLQESHEYLKPTFLRSEKSSKIANDYWESGNYYYKRGEFERAMECYNLSLVLAPHPFLKEDPTMHYGHDEDLFVPERIEPHRYNAAESCNEDSTALAMAYANRSAVFYKIGLYERCLRDIRLALQNDYPLEFKDVLEKRKKNCLKALAGGKRKTRTVSKSEKESCKRKDSTCLENAFNALNIESSCSEKNSTDLVDSFSKSSKNPSGSDKNSSTVNKKPVENGKTPSISNQDATETDEECYNSGRKISSSNRSSRNSGKKPYKRPSKAGKDTNKPYKGSTASRKHVCSCSYCKESSKSDQGACGSNKGTKNCSSDDNPNKNSSDKNEEHFRSNSSSLVSGKDTPLSNMEALGAVDTGDSDSNLATFSLPKAPFCLDVRLPDFTTSFTGPNGESEFAASLKKSNSNSTTKSLSSSEEFSQLKSSSEASHSSKRSCSPAKVANSVIRDNVSNKESSRQSTELINESTNFGLQTCTSNNINSNTSASLKNRNSSNSDMKSLSSSKESSQLKSSLEASHSKESSCGSAKDSSSMRSDFVSDKESLRQSSEAVSESNNFSQQTCTSDIVNPDTSVRRKNRNFSSSDSRSLGSSQESSKLTTPSEANHLGKSSCGSGKDSRPTKSDSVSGNESSRRSLAANNEYPNFNQQACASNNINPDANAKLKNGNSSGSNLKSLGSSKESSKLKSSLKATHSDKSSCGSAKDSSSMKSASASDKVSIRHETVTESATFSQEDLTSEINLGTCPERYDSDTVSTGSNDDYEDTTNESRKAMKDLLEAKPISDCCRGAHQMKSLFTSDECRSPVIKDPHPEIPAFTSAVRLGHHSVKGKSVYANRYIRPGEVLAVEPAFCLSSDWKRLAFACGYCLRDVIDPLPCPGCVLITFCSEACRYEALAEDHWLECTILPTLDALGLHHRNLAYKMFKTLDYNHLMALLGEGKKKRPRRRKNKAGGRKGPPHNATNPKTAASHRCWQDMCTNLDKQSFEYLFVQCQTAFMLTTLLVQSRKFFVDEDGVGIDPSREAVLRTGAVVLSNILKIRSNALELIDKGRKISLGVGIYHWISIINHSCNPSAEEYNCGRDMVIRAIRPIYEGEEITISYVWNYYEARLEDRATDLLMYSIICSCEACLFGWGTYYQLPYVSMNLMEKGAHTEEFANAITDSLQIGVKVTSGIRISPEERETLIRAIELLYIIAPMPCQDLCYVQKLLLMSFLLERN